MGGIHNPRAVSLYSGWLAAPTAPYWQLCAVDCLQVQAPSNRGGASRQPGRNFAQGTAPLFLIKLRANVMDPLKRRVVPSFLLGLFPNHVAPPVAI